MVYCANGPAYAEQLQNLSLPTTSSMTTAAPTFMRARMRGKGVRCRPLSCATAAADCVGLGLGHGLFLPFGDKLLKGPLGDMLKPKFAAAEKGLSICTVSVSCADEVPYQPAAASCKECRRLCRTIEIYIPFSFAK